MAARSTILRCWRMRPLQRSIAAHSRGCWRGRICTWGFATWPGLCCYTATSSRAIAGSVLRLPFMACLLCQASCWRAGSSLLCPWTLRRPAGTTRRRDAWWCSKRLCSASRCGVALPCLWPWPRRARRRSRLKAVKRARHAHGAGCANGGGSRQRGARRDRRFSRLLPARTGTLPGRVDAAYSRHNLSFLVVCLAHACTSPSKAEPQTRRAPQSSAPRWPRRPRGRPARRPRAQTAPGSPTHAAAATPTRLPGPASPKMRPQHSLRTAAVPVHKLERQGITQALHSAWLL